MAFIVGNPPFIGNKRMRTVLGGGYCDALRSAWADVPDSSDFVMYWWSAAAAIVSASKARQFGLIATNSLTQAFNRRVVERALATVDVSDESEKPDGNLSLVYAIPDHPWVDSADGAAVRISMSVGRAGLALGTLATVRNEIPLADGSAAIEFVESTGRVHATLSIGADVGAARALRANAQLALRGITVVGSGFVLSRLDVEALGYDVNGLPPVIRKFLNGRDVLQSNRGVYVIDLFDHSVDESRSKYPSLYQWLWHRVKPERDQNARSSYREKWWTFAEPRSDFRFASAQLDQYIATPMTAKHRLFVFVSSDVLPDQGLVPISANDSRLFGVLSSRTHIVWSIATGGTLEDRPRYNQSECFEPFPFPNFADQPALAAQIAATAEELDAHRKRQQAAHSTLTLTDMYNVLDALRLSRPLTAKEKLTHTNGLVSVLSELHDRLDALVLQAYGWADLAPALIGQPGGTLPWPERPAAQAAAEEELLVRLVALNAERAVEESRGTVRWLRPEFQDPAQRGAAPAPVQVQEELDIHRDDGPVSRPTQGDQPSVVVVASKRPWPVGVPEQIKAVAELLRTTARPLGLTEIEASFTARGRWRDRLPTLLETLEALGRARRIVGPAETWQAR